MARTISKKVKKVKISTVPPKLEKLGMLSGASLSPTERATRISRITSDVEKQIDDSSVEFVVTITIENSTYQGTGQTALTALQSVPAPTLDLLGSGSVRVEHGDKFKEMYFNGPQMKRFLNPYCMEVLIGEFSVGL